MDNLVNAIRRIFFGQHQSGEEDFSQDDQDLAFDAETMKNLVQLLEKTEEGQYTCEETFALLDEYVDLMIDQQQAETIMPLVKGHIDCCPDCRERYETLVTILESP